MMGAALDRGADKARELANIGAGHAAGALARLVNRPIWTEVPSAETLRPEPALRARSVARDGTAVFFKLHGGVEGMLAIVFSRGSLEIIVTEIMGAAAYDAESAVESAVREAANILVSHYASAIADTLGAVVLPSVPVLTEHSVQAALDSVTAWDEAMPRRLLLEVPLFDEQREIEAYVVVVT
jgi:chemotaxis protein CheC